MKKFWSICGFMCMVLLLQAQEVKFTVEISSDTLLVGNYFELKYTIENASAKNFEPPRLQNLHIVGGPNTSTRMSFVNGEISQSTTYTYFIEPPDIGSYTIPPAFLTTDDVSLEVPPIDVIALPNPEGIVQKPHQGGKKYEPVNASSQAEETPKRPRKKF
jgi:oxygen tolerance protein BatD